jgi:hypothetical protein
MKTLTRKAHYKKLTTSSLIHFSPQFPWRVWREQECAIGFDAGRMVDVGHNDYVTESEAIKAVEEWEK